MRFHHSTRRGRNRLAHHNKHSAGRSIGGTSVTSRLSHLGYCRETNIYFNRRLPVEPPKRQESPCAAKYLRKDPMNALDLQLQRHLHLGQEHNLKSSAQVDELTLDKMSLKDTNKDRKLMRRKQKLKRQKDKDSMEQIEKEEESAKLDMEAARQKLIAQVEKHPFWSNKAAKRMKLTKVEERLVYIYELTSYCERRELEWRFEPYKGGLISSTPLRYIETPPGTSIEQQNRRAENFHDQEAQESTTKLSGKRETQLLVALESDKTQLSPQRSGHLECLSTASTLSMSSALATSPSHRLQRLTIGNASKTPIRRARSGGASQLVAETDDKWPGSNDAAKVPPDSIATPDQYLREPRPSVVWSIEVPANYQPKAFVGSVFSSELPQSSFVKRCHGCQGRGRLKCNSCHGVGYEVCLTCSGKGTTKNPPFFGSSHSTSQSRSCGRPGDSYGHNTRNSSSANGYDANNDLDTSPFGGSDSGRGRNEPGGISTSNSLANAWVTESCHFCHGAGQKRCWVCAGKSYNHCFGCAGSGQLRCYLNVNISWINHKDECLLNNLDNIIPRDRLKLSSGLVLVDQVDSRLGPLERTSIEGATRNSVEAEQLEAASNRLLERHAQIYHQEHLVKQRHKVTRIECFVVSYEWKQKRGHFVIYGDERKVYIAKYPFKSICNIT